MSKRRRMLRGRAVGLALLAGLLMPGPAGAAGKDGWTLPVPTLGGRQVWSDVLVRDGWRVQKNLLTGRHRAARPR